MKSTRIISSILALSMLLPLAACGKKATQTPSIEGYNLLWSDEFDGDKLDETKWNREKREPGWTNNELQEYTESERRTVRLITPPARSTDGINHSSSTAK